MKKILIIEDELLISKVYAMHLKTSGYLITNCCTNVKDAIVAYKEDTPDLILIDINLRGEETGFDLADEIRSLENTPIIFTTGSSDASTKDQCAKYKNASILTKPVQVHSLKSAIEQFLN